MTITSHSLHAKPVKKLEHVTSRADVFMIFVTWSGNHLQLGSHAQMYGSWLELILMF